LEIFGERAQTKEGKLQVELAHLTYQRSRLVRSWTHLERQRGGAGFLGGPGETQIELDRRIIVDKILKIKQSLEKVKQTRQIQRSARKRVPYASVAFVGYTNAGKSTLFNKLSKSNVFAKDLLFATLDPSMRKIKLPSGREVVLSDTVGFISDLPHELVMSFRATLEEVLSADLIVHIRDISSPNSNEQKKDVLSVLDSLGFNEIEKSAKYIEVLNKIDLLDEEIKANIISKQKIQTVPLSAISGEGCDKLLKLIDDKLSSDFDVVDIDLHVSDGKKIAWIHSNSEVISSIIKEEKMYFKVKISKENLAKFNFMK
jgi:GTP-binding protein HflX